MLVEFSTVHGVNLNAESKGVGAGVPSWLVFAYLYLPSIAISLRTQLNCHCFETCKSCVVVPLLFECRFCRLDRQLEERGSRHIPQLFFESIGNMPRQQRHDSLQT